MLYSVNNNQEGEQPDLSLGLSGFLVGVLLLEQDVAIRRPQLMVGAP